MATISGFAATLLSATLLILTTACGNDAAGADTAPSREQARPLVVTAAPVAFDVPPSWRVLDADLPESSLQASADALGVTTDQLAQQLEQIEVMAAEPRPDDGFLDNVNVTRAPLPLPTSRQLRNQLMALGATDVETDAVTHPEVGELVASRYVLPVGATEAHASTLSFVGPGEVVTVTVTTDEPDQTERLAKEILATLRPSS